MRKLFRSLGMIAVLALTVGVAVTLTPAPEAEAATASDFSAGNIISDDLFFNGATMSGQEVQNFLNSKVPSCTAADLCLRHYNVTTPNRAAALSNSPVVTMCNAYNGMTNESAASIIARVGAACGISQKALIILLEKEQSLITMKNPSQARINIATGYACPDTAACDVNYYGFFNQVYSAALQFKRYQRYGSSYFAHAAGKTSSVLYNPSSSCGSGKVYMENAATAALYNYTPYQPNAAAMNNLYGTGDKCSSYGNRNFWRLYTDWFGPTTGYANLIKATGSNDTYFLTGGKRHLLSKEMVGAFTVLGAVQAVTPTELAKFTLGQPATRLIRDDAMKMYYVYGDKKYPLPTCEDMAAFGGVCGINGFVQMTNAQSAKFATGATLGRVITAGDYISYAVSGATRHEIADNESRATAGYSFPASVVPAALVTSFPLGKPILNDSSFTQQIGSSAVQYLYDGRRWATTANGLAVRPSGMQIGTLSAASMNMFTSVPGSFDGVVTRTTAAQREQLLPGGTRWSYSASVITSLPATGAFIDRYRLLGTVKESDNVKIASSNRISRATNTGLRLADSWEAVKATSAPASPSYHTIPDLLMAKLPQSHDLLTPGYLYSAGGTSQLYFIDALNTKIPVTSTAALTEAGITTRKTTSANTISRYVTDSSMKLGYGYVCNGSSYIAAGGALVKVDPKLYPIPFVKLAASTCQQMTFASKAASKFIQTPSAIYLTEGGKLRLVETTQRFNELGGKMAGVTKVSTQLTDLIPKGPKA